MITRRSDVGNIGMQSVREGGMMFSEHGDAEFFLRDADDFEAALEALIRTGGCFVQRRGESNA